MRRLLAVAVLAFAAACGGDSTGPDDAGIEGTYHLKTVNGQNLPFEIGELADTVAYVTGAQIVLASNGTFTDSSTIELRVGTTAARTERVGTRGTYVRTGNSVSFRPAATEEVNDYLLTFDGENTLTQTEPGFVIVYRRD